MADNAAQAVGKLDERIKELNSDLQDSMSKLAKYDKDIANLFEQVAQNTKIQTDEVVDYISKKLKTIAIKDYSEGLLGTKEAKEAAKAADAYFKTSAEKTEAENRRQLEINKAYNEREMQLAEQREKQKLQIEKVYAQERERLAEAEAKKRMEMEKAWAEHDKQVAASRTDLNKLGDLAATRGLTGNLATLQDTSAYKRYMEERKRLTKQTAQEEAAATKKTNQAIQQQIQYYRQLHTLYKEYKALQAKPNKTEKDNEILEQTKKKILDILNLSKKLELENKGSTAIAKQATAWERVRDRAKEAKKETKSHNDELNKMLPTLRRLASAFGVAFSVRGLVQFGKKLIETRGEFEMQQVALRSILQNKQLADEIWDKTMQAALQSPFTAMQLTKYTKQLAAYRIETSKLFDTTKMLADVSAGLGVDMQRLILAYGQVKAANYLRASEIRQFTEAGVNILGELAQYFTDTRDKMYSTAEVMEMVTKRMVKFEDVEAIFKRMTEAGGVFYDMQYIQSQTVKGQIAKLHDAYDQMLNSIGKANQGVLKDLVSALNSIVQNWRTWAVVLKSIAWGAIIGYLSKFALQLFGIQKASVATLRSIAKLKIGIESLGVALKNAWPMLAIAAVAATISAVVNQVKKVNAELKEMQEKNLRLFETKENLEGYKKALEENNAAIRSGALSQDELNKKQDENRSILKKLQNDYPNLVKDVEQHKDGTVELTNALSDYNDELERLMNINYLLAQQEGGMFSDTHLQNLKDWSKDLSNIKGQILSIQNAARTGLTDLLVKKTQAPEEYNQELYDLLEKISKVDLKDVIQARNEINKLVSEAYNYGEIIGTVYYGGGSEIERKMPYNLRYIASETQKENEKKAATAFEQIQRNLNDSFLQAVLGIEEYDKQIIDKSENGILNFIANNTEIINKGVKDGSKDVVRFVRTAFQSQGLAVTKEEQEYYNKLLNEQLKYIYIQKQLSEVEINNLSEYFKKAKEASESYIPINFFAAPESAGGGNGDGDQQSEIDAAWRRRINLLEEMKRRFDELNKSAYGFERSRKLIVKAFDDIRDAQGNVIEKGAFSTIFEGTGITIGQVDVTSMEGMFKSMRLLLQQATDISESVKEELMKKIDSYEARITISAEVEKQNEFYKSLDKMFSDYDLTLDLEKLELPTDELADIFQFTPTTLDKIRETIEREKERRTLAGEDPKDFINKYNEYLNKIDDLERKALVNRLKTYTEYLAKGRDEAVKIHLEELKMMAELDELAAEGYYTDTQRKDIADKIKTDTQQKLAKNEWQSFKESDFYVTMFQDLEHVSQVSIDIMLKKLGELRKQMKDLDPTQVKEITKSMEKLEKVKLQRSPIAQFFKNKEISKAWDKKGDETLLDTLFGKEEKLKKDKELVSAVVAQAQKDFDDLSQNGTAEDAAEAKEYLEQSQEVLDKINEDLEKTQEEIDEVNKRNNEGYEALKRRQQAMVNGVGYFNQMVDAAMTVNQEMMDMMDGVSDASKKLAKDIAEIATNAGLLAKDIVQAIYSEGTDVGAMIDGLVRTWNIIKGWLSAKERSINQDIEDNTNALKDYEEELNRVQRARERAWDAHALVQYQNELNQTIRKQRDAYDAMIKAEEKRKNPDEDLIRQWKSEMAELDRMLEDEKEKFMQVFGGIGEGGYRDAAQAFVDAWTEAFLETGDGLEGLQDHFNEFLQEWFVKQATMRIAGKMLQPLFEQIDRAVDQYGTGSTSVLMSELNAIREKFGIIAPQLSDALEALAGQWGLDGEGGLSGLAAGIQGMTEEQANILESYWNSVRGYTASIDMNVSRIVEMLGAGGVNTNPMLEQLSTIALNTGYIPRIYNMLEPMQTNEGSGRGWRAYPM